MHGNWSVYVWERVHINTLSLVFFFIVCITHTSMFWTKKKHISDYARHSKHNLIRKTCLVLPVFSLSKLSRVIYSVNFQFHWCNLVVIWHTYIFMPKHMQMHWLIVLPSFVFVVYSHSLHPANVIRIENYGPFNFRLAHHFRKSF